MKIKAKRIFSAALAAALLSAIGGLAATETAAAAAAPAPVAAPAATNVSPSDEMAKLFGDPVVAKGKGIEVKRSQLDAEVQRIKTTMAAQGRTLTPDDIAQLQPRVLNDLITKELLLSKATAADQAKGQADFDKVVQQLKTAGKLTDDQFNQKLDAQLKLLNLTKAQWEKQSVDQTTALAVLKRELNITVTDAEIKAFYNSNSAEFEQPEMVRAAHILLSTRDPVTGAELSDAQKAEKRKEMEGILKRARAGENFSNLVAQYSEDPGSKGNGGEYTFPRGKMVPEFEAAAFSLTNNQISDIVTTQFGYHIIKLYEKIPAHKLALTDKLPSSDVTVAEDVRNYLEQQKLAKLAPAYLKKLNQDAAVEILDPSLKPAMADEAMEPGALPVAPPK